MEIDESHVALERAVMDLLLAGDHPVLDCLRRQFTQARVAKRMLSGVGFMTDYALPDDVELVQGKSLFFLSDAAADLNGQPNAAGFHAQIKGGRLKLLEGFSFEEVWPVQIFDMRVYYKYPAGVLQAHGDWDGTARILDYVEQQWQGR